MEHPEDEHQEPPAGVVIEMVEINPFVHAAQVLPEINTRHHRITPQTPVGVRDGRQIPTCVVRSELPSRRSRLLRGSHRRNRPPRPAVQETGVVEDQPAVTEDRRQWIDMRESRREEERRSPWSTVQKMLCFSVVVLAAVVAIIAILVWTLSESLPENAARRPPVWRQRLF
ncbi:unnamed protein product [Larinioides sclopetarius]|uniref:Uncharacterized protein n=1 Tax=Larinioides sclopetarius TaxID=280406 RepID=A0AAV2AL90_9ARAC